jgi:hypothetical protein
MLGVDEQHTTAVVIFAGLGRRPEQSRIAQDFS